MNIKNKASIFMTPQGFNGLIKTLKALGATVDRNDLICKVGANGALILQALKLNRRGMPTLYHVFYDAEMFTPSQPQSKF